MAAACPICGYELSFAPYEDGLASFEICPCCGNQFGYDDATRSHEELRGDWIAKGMPWFSAGPKPPNWNPAKQLERFR
jgi:hypothetical protein